MFANIVSCEPSLIERLNDVTRPSKSYINNGSKNAYVFGTKEYPFSTYEFIGRHFDFTNQSLLELINAKDIERIWKQYTVSGDVGTSSLYGHKNKEGKWDSLIINNNYFNKEDDDNSDTDDNFLEEIKGADNNDDNIDEETNNEVYQKKCNNSFTFNNCTFNNCIFK
jgi:hypothetical protein